MLQVTRTDSLRLSLLLSSWARAGRTMVGIGPAGAITCRDGCHGVDMDGSPGLGYLHGTAWDKGNFQDLVDSITRLQAETGHQTETPSDCHVEGAAADPNPKSKAKPDIRGPMVWPKGDTRDHAPFTNRGSCGRITPVTAENELAAFPSHLFNRGSERSQAL